MNVRKILFSRKFVEHGAASRRDDNRPPMLPPRQCRHIRDRDSEHEREHVVHGPLARLHTGRGRGTSWCSPSTRSKRSSYTPSTRPVWPRRRTRYAPMRSGFPGRGTRDSARGRATGQLAQRAESERDPKNERSTSPGAFRESESAHHGSIEGTPDRHEDGGRESNRHRGPDHAAEQRGEDKPRLSGKNSREPATRLKTEEGSTGGHAERAGKRSGGILFVCESSSWPMRAEVRMVRVFP